MPVLPGVFFLVAVALSAGCGPSAGKVPAVSPQLIDEVLSAYGTPAARSAVRAYRMTGTLHATMRGEVVTVIRTFARPDSLRVVVAYAAGPETRVLASRKGWRSTAEGTVVPVEGPLLASMALQAARANVPWVLEDHRNEVKAIDSLTVEGKILAGLEIVLSEGMTLRLYVDPETHLVARTQSLLSSTQFSTMFETIYADFREVDGVRFAFREENFASGAATGITAIERIEINPRLDPEVFRPSLDASHSVRKV